jgi:hypothetical protein
MSAYADMYLVLVTGYNDIKMFYNRESARKYAEEVNEHGTDNVITYAVYTEHEAVTEIDCLYGEG